MLVRSPVLCCWVLSPSAPQKLLNRVIDAFLVAYLRQRQVVFVFKRFFQLPIELARTIWALDLAVAEQVALGKKLVAQKPDALAVVFAPVVSVGKMEHVDIPVGLGMLVVDDLVGKVIGRAVSGPAALACVIKGMLVDLAGDRV